MTVAEHSFSTVVVVWGCGTVDTATIDCPLELASVWAPTLLDSIEVGAILATTGVVGTAATAVVVGVNWGNVTAGCWVMMVVSWSTPDREVASTTLIIFSSSFFAGSFLKVVTALWANNPCFRF